MATSCQGCWCECLLEGLPSAIYQLLNIDREVNIVADTVPGELLMLTNQMMAHVGQQQNSPLMKAPFGDFSAECFIASTHTTAHKVDMKTMCTAADHKLYRQMHELCLDELQRGSRQCHWQWNDSWHEQQHDSIVQ